LGRRRRKGKRGRREERAVVVTVAW